MRKPSTKKIAKRLDELSVLRTEEQVLRELRQAVIDATPEVQAYNGQINALSEKMAALTTRIKEDVLRLEESVKGQWLQAVLAKGRTTWDTKKLEGYAIAHPEIERFKKTGNPTVSIRKRKA